MSNFVEETQAEWRWVPKQVAWGKEPRYVWTYENVDVVKGNCIQCGVGMYGDEPVMYCEKCKGGK